jgi:5,10-methylenetetrahydrofolate reductase
VPVPNELMERMQRAHNPEDAGKEGLAIACEMVQRVRPLVQGVQLSAPFGRYHLGLKVAVAIGPR